MSHISTKENKHDDWKIVITSILFAKAAVAAFSIAPFLIGGYIDHLKLNPIPVINEDA